MGTVRKRMELGGLWITLLCLLLLGALPLPGVQGNSSFPCNDSRIEGPRGPSTVHELTPGDIQVIGAIGDSLTRGQGIMGNPNTDDPGFSFSIGGSDNFQAQATIPNILKIYNPKLYGYSTGSGRNAKWGFNVAVKSATAGQAISQANRLVSLMKNDPKVDMDNDWKLVTILLGLGELCRDCNNGNVVGVYQNNMRQIVKTLQQMPRTIVNLCSPGD